MFIDDPVSRTWNLTPAVCADVAASSILRGRYLTNRYQRQFRGACSNVSPRPGTGVPDRINAFRRFVRCRRPDQASSTHHRRRSGGYQTVRRQCRHWAACPVPRRRRFTTESVGIAYPGDRSSAGSSTIGRFCRPLDAIDFEQRDWVPHSGWPFGRRRCCRITKGPAISWIAPPRFDDKAYWERVTGEPLPDRSPAGCRSGSCISVRPPISANAMAANWRRRGISTCCSMQTW